MAFISSRIDRAIVLGRGAIGSHQLAGLSVYREKLARSAVGSGQQGTLTAARLIGTVSNLDIGSGFFSYGSAGTWAGRFSRGQTGSFSGTFTARRFQTRGAAAGLDANLVFGAYGSLTGTIRAPISRGLRGSFGTVTGQFVRSRYGSYAGSLASPFIRGVRGSFGTAQGFFRGRFAAQGRYLTGSVGSFSRSLGGAGGGGATTDAGSLTRGTLGLARLTRQITGRGTISTDVGFRVDGLVDSFRITGSLTGRIRSSAGMIFETNTGGTIIFSAGGAVNQISLTRSWGLFQYMGTKVAGSVSSDGWIGRYAVWPTPFSNATYRPLIIAELGRPGGLAGETPNYVTVISRSPGSMRYAIANTNSTNNIRIGSVHIYAFPNV